MNFIFLNIFRLKKHWKKPSKKSCANVSPIRELQRFSKGNIFVSFDLHIFCFFNGLVSSTKQHCNQRLCKMSCMTSRGRLWSQTVTYAQDTFSVWKLLSKLLETAFKNLVIFAKRVAHAKKYYLGDIIMLTMFLLKSNFRAHMSPLRRKII